MIDIAQIFNRYTPFYERKEIVSRHGLALPLSTEDLQAFLHKCTEPFQSNPNLQATVIEEAGISYYVILKQKNGRMRPQIFRQDPMAAKGGSYNKVYMATKIHTGKPCILKTPRACPSSLPTFTNNKVATEMEKAINQITRDAKYQVENSDSPPSPVTSKVVKNPLMVRKEWPKVRQAELLNEQKNLLSLHQKATQETFSPLCPKVEGQSYVPFIKPPSVCMNIDGRQLSFLERGSQTLLDFRRESPRTAETITQMTTYVDQILDTLKLLEAMDVVIPDVKTENMMLFPTGKTFCPKLIDLGAVYALPVGNAERFKGQLSLIHSKTEEPLSLIHSNAYVSPEAKVWLSQSKTQNNACVRDALRFWMRTSFARSLFDLFCLGETDKDISQALNCPNLQASPLFSHLALPQQQLLQKLLDPSLPNL